MLTASRVTVASANATSILAGGDPAGNQVSIGRGFALIKNLDAAIVIYLGGDSAVTSGTGFPLNPGDVFKAEALGAGDAIFGRAASGTPSVAVLYQE